MFSLILGYDNAYFVDETMLGLMVQVMSLSRASPLKFRSDEFLSEAIHE